MELLGLKVGLYDLGEALLRGGILATGLSLLAAALRRRGMAKLLLDVAILGIFVASGILLYALITSDMRLLYVQSYTSKALPLFYKITAWWGGQAGSLLFWMFVLGTYALLSLRKEPHPILTATFSAVLMFFLITSTYAANPFERTLDPAPDGRGLNPLLQNIWMAVHPPTLYLGYVGMTVPFAYALLGIFAGFNEEVIRKIRVWLLTAWVMLSVGIVLGGRWAYLELGWGGYWAWDPVENASLIPWLTAAAAVHTFHLVRRGTHKMWFYNLTVASFLLSILGTFLTRSGLIESVHAFAFSDIGNYFLVFLGVGTVLWLLSVAYLLVSPRHRRMRSERVRYPPLSRGWFLDAANYVWLLLTLIVLAGTFSPLLTEMVVGTQITTKPEFFTYATAPFWTLVILAVAFSLLASWKGRPSSWGPVALAVAVAVGILPLIFGRNVWASVALTATLYPLLLLLGRMVRLGRRSLRDMALLSHLGVLITAVGIALSWNYSRSHEMAFKGREVKDFYAFQLQHLGWQEYDGPNYEAVFSVLDVKLLGWDLGEIKTERRRYFASGEVTTEPGILPLFPFGDLYVVMQGAEEDGTFYYDVRFVPGIQLVWLGPVLFFVAGLLVALGAARGRF
ncbi:MAG: heme lyase CcmF/NrfE family subunit [Thermotogae bacterium]|nr:heme lyase CcmF/NrfE family subunit [Thermotogota bacterium]